MGRIGISEYQVFQAADLLLADGVRPSVDTVRVELGNTGSRTTINKYLKLWREQRAHREAAGTNLSGHLRQVITEQAEILLTALEAESSAKLHEKQLEFEAGIQSLHEKYQQLEQQHASAQSIIESLRETNERHVSTLRHQHSELTDMREQNQSQREALAKEVGRRETLERAMADRDRQLTALQKELKASSSRNEILNESIATKVAELQQSQQKEREQRALGKDKAEEIRLLKRELTTLRSHSEKSLSKLAQSLGKLLNAQEKKPAKTKARRMAHR